MVEEIGFEVWKLSERTCKWKHCRGTEDYTSMFLAAISVEASPLVLYNIFCLFISSNLVLCTFVFCFNCELMNNLHFMASVHLSCNSLYKT